MANPNFAPTKKMLALASAAKAAAVHNTNWERAERGSLKGVRGRFNHQYLSFRVTYGGGTYEYKLTASGVIMEGNAPLQFATLTERQQHTMKNALEALARQP